MTKFNPEGKDKLTYGEALGPAMEITDKEDAKQYKIAYMYWTQRHMESPSNAKAEEIVNTNLGYYAGYYSNEVRQRVEDLFECSHPIFGSIQTNGIPTEKEAFECGKSEKTLSEVRTT